MRALACSSSFSTEARSVFDVGVALGQQLLLGLDGLDQLGDLGLRGSARLSRVMSSSRWAAAYSLVFLAADCLLLALARWSSSVCDQALLLGVVALGLGQLGPLVGEQPFDTGQVVLGGFELGGDGLQGVVQLLNLGIVLLKLFELLKLIAQNCPPSFVIA